MVVSRSDSKRRKKDDGSIPDSPKRTKVHAQRKFAQGPHLNSPSLTPVKDKDKGRTATTASASVTPVELPPAKRPKTEAFVDFLCFRGSDLLPKSLEFFNEPTIPEPLEDERRDSSAGTSKATGRSEKHSDQSGSSSKADAKSKTKPKATVAVQALKKKYQEQRLNKTKTALTKLALKVKGKNMVRTRSSGPLDEAPTKTQTKKPPKTSKLAVSTKKKPVAAQKPALKKNPVMTKRPGGKTSTRGGLRSSGEPTPIKSTVKPKHKPATQKPPTPSAKKVKKPSPQSDFSSDDEQPLAKKQRVNAKRALLARRVTTRSSVRPPSHTSRSSKRPTRKTKEAATLFMEMLRSPEEEEDEDEENGDAMSVESIVQPPNTKQSDKKEKESKQLAEKQSLEEKKEQRRTHSKVQPSTVLPIPKTKENSKVVQKTATELANLRARSLRKNSYRLLAKETKQKVSFKAKSIAATSLKTLRGSKKSVTEEKEQLVKSTLQSSSDSRRETRSGLSNQVESNKKPNVKSKAQRNSLDVKGISNTKASKTKSPADTKAVFNDSDEEPLGNKVNSTTDVSVKKSNKILKSSVKDEPPSAPNSAKESEQTTAKKKAATLSQETSKESAVLPQVVTRRRQSLNNILPHSGETQQIETVKVTKSDCEKKGADSTKRSRSKEKTVEKSASKSKSPACKNEKDSEIGTKQTATGKKPTKAKSAITDKEMETSVDCGKEVASGKSNPKVKQLDNKSEIDKVSDSKKDLISGKSSGKLKMSSIKNEPEKGFEYINEATSKSSDIKFNCPSNANLYLDSKTELCSTKTETQSLSSDVGQSLRDADCKKEFVNQNKNKKKSTPTKLSTEETQNKVKTEHHEETISLENEHKPLNTSFKPMDAKEKCEPEEKKRNSRTNNSQKAETFKDFSIPSTSSKSEESKVVSEDKHPSKDSANITNKTKTKSDGKVPVKEKKVCKESNESSTSIQLNIANSLSVTNSKAGQNAMKNVSKSVGSKNKNKIEDSTSKEDVLNPKKDISGIDIISNFATITQETKKVLTFSDEKKIVGVIPKQESKTKVDTKKEQKSELNLDESNKVGKDKTGDITFGAPTSSKENVKQKISLVNKSKIKTIQSEKVGQSELHNKKSCNEISSTKSSVSSPIQAVPKTSEKQNPPRDLKLSDITAGKDDYQILEKAKNYNTKQNFKTVTDSAKPQNVLTSSEAKIMSTNSELEVLTTSNGVTVPTPFSELVVTNTNSELNVPTTSSGLAVLPASGTLTVPNTSSGLTVTNTSSGLTITKMSSRQTVATKSTELILPSNSESTTCTTEVNQPDTLNFNFGKELYDNKLEVSLSSDKDKMNIKNEHQVAQPVQTHSLNINKSPDLTSQLSSEVNLTTTTGHVYEPPSLPKTKSNKTFGSGAYQEKLSSDSIELKQTMRDAQNEKQIDPAKLLSNFNTSVSFTSVSPENKSVPHFTSQDHILNHPGKNNSSKPPTQIPNQQIVRGVRFDVKDQPVVCETTNKAVKPDELKSILKEDSSFESRHTNETLEFDKISSAVVSLMSLKNIQKIDVVQESVYSGVSSIKNSKGFDTEPKLQVQDFEYKRTENIDTKRVKFQENSEVKRVTIVEPDLKRNQGIDNDYRRFHYQDLKAKPGPSQVLKGCSNPKSMLKPGTLIDIASISHSPDIMTPLRPGSDGEIISMNKPVRLGMPDQFRMAMPGPRPFEPRTDQIAYTPRWQSPEKSGLKLDQTLDKESTDPKSKAPVNQTVWRDAFKNVKDSKSNSNVPVEKPAVKKQISLTSLTKRHIKPKAEVAGNERPNIPQQPIPFIRQTKPFAEGSQSKGKLLSDTTKLQVSEAKKTTTDIDFSSLREKEAEVEEFVRQLCVNGELAKSFTPVSQASSSNSTNQPSVNIQTEQGSLANKTPLPQFRNIAPQSMTPSDPNNSSVFSPNFKRANSPSSRFNKQSFETGIGLVDPTPVSKVSISIINQQQDQSFQSNDLFKDSPFKRSSSPKGLQPVKSGFPTSFSQDNLNKQLQSPSQVNTLGVNTKLEIPQACSTTSVSITTQQSGTSDNLFKQIQPRLSSPTRSASDNIFKDGKLVKRTNSPTMLGSPQQLNRSNSPQSNPFKRNSNSPVSMRTSKNIFKEVVPAIRSYSPTLSSTSQSDDSLNNIFSQTPNFKRSVSPLCNKPATTSGSVGGVGEENSAKTNIVLPGFKELSNSVATPKVKDSFTSMSSVQSTKTPVTSFPDSTIGFSGSLSLTADNQSIFLNIKKESEEIVSETKLSSASVGPNNYTEKPQTEPNNGKEISQSHNKSDLELQDLTGSEGKHRLPLPVEQTLKKLSQSKPSPNKKTLQPQKITSDELGTNVSSNQSSRRREEQVYIATNTNFTDNISKSADPIEHKVSTSIYGHIPEGELDLMLNKKVNMSAEVIKRWLNESSGAVEEQNLNCGILDNNSFECDYKNTVASNQQAYGNTGTESVKTEVDNIKTNQDVNILNSKLCDIRNSISNKSNVGINESVIVQNVTQTKDSFKTSVNEDILKGEFKNSSASQDKKTISNQMKEPKSLPLRILQSTPSKQCEKDEALLETPTTPPAKKIFRLATKSPGADLDTSLDMSGVSSPPLRDDFSSSNLSSSNEESPDKSSNHERRSIFHQRRSALKVKERRELLSRSATAFSPENESSVYAFEPDLPPASTPFRRSKGKASATPEEDEPSVANSSTSIAVQVNFDNEAVLECSTQTDTQEGEEDDTHTFYIPLSQQSSSDTTKSPLIQGVAVKVDTEGLSTDQKVIMRAKLVTKPLSTFSRSSTSPGRGLMGPRAGKPEQKVRPLSVKPPVGTVQPTARPRPGGGKERSPKPSGGKERSPKPSGVKERSPKPSGAKEDKESPGPSQVCSPQAARLAKRIKNKSVAPSTNVSETPPPKVTPAQLVEAPTFYPTEKEFEDPLEYISSITPLAEKFGLCRVVPPSNFKPECKVSDDMRFTAYNQYVHKMLHRWGPNVKEMLAIRRYLATQSIALTHPPWIGGMEVDLPRLYQTVQQCGGLKEVIEKKRWQRVADSMKIPKSAQDRVTKLDDIYCKFLLPYDTLSHAERTKLFEEVEKDWVEREKRAANSEEEDDDDSESDSDIDECIVKGRSMALNAFYRIARNTMSMWFPKTDNPLASDVELEFWKHVASRQHHLCVHSGSIDTGAAGYGFPTAKNSPTSRHPWNLKVLTNHSGSVLRSLGPLMGVTLPTLHVGMLFSACCWYRDPHGLPWIEYLHTGASKIWYGIPDGMSPQFRAAVEGLVPRLCRDKALWLASDTAMVPPPLLVERGVSLSRVVQEPGQFIVVLPRAFTSSVSTGYVVSESVYFAPPSWLSTAHLLFNEMKESSEPTMFSLEKLLFSIVNDPRSTPSVLNQILPTVVSLRDGEVAGRRQLEELGLSSSERMSGGKQRKSRPASEDEEDHECETCRTSLYISFMTNSQDGADYCLPHAVELLSHRRSLVKHCTLLYAFSEDELEDLVEKLKSRVENKSQKKGQAKSSKS